jgi:CheY-like chemotaxis protein
VCHRLASTGNGFDSVYLFNRKIRKGGFQKRVEMGADDYITKPFDGIELLNAIEVRLKKRIY